MYKIGKNNDNTLSRNEPKTSRGDVQITFNENMNIFFNDRTKCLYFKDYTGLEYDLNGYSRNFVGAIGEQGPIGPMGLKGAKGEIGYSGERGIKGSEGPPGKNGTDGKPGFTGKQGLRGLKGSNGEKGIKGDTGDQGPCGKQGNRGYKGDQGDQGLKGEVGSIGERGLNGDRGPRGDSGPIGEKGPRGEKGDQGERGHEGLAGICSCQNTKNLTLTSNPKSFFICNDFKTIQASQLSFDIPSNPKFIYNLNFTKCLRKNDSCSQGINNSSIHLSKKGYYQIKYNICWLVNVSKIAENLNEKEYNRITNEVKKTIKLGIIALCHKDNEIISQSTLHSIGSLYVNSASQSFIINNKETSDIHLSFHSVAHNNIPIEITDESYCSLEYLEELEE